MKKVKIIAGLLAVAGALSTAHAVDKLITVTASIDPSLDLTQADGSALPSTVAMSYNPSAGLQDYTIQTRLYKTDTTNNVTMSLSTQPVLTSLNDASKTIPLTVKYNGKEVTTTPWAASNALSKDIFTDGQSPAMPMVISADNTNKSSWTAGEYQGVINLIVATVAP